MTDRINVNKWEELRLAEQLVSHRHLPSNTWLPKPPHQADGELITELLHSRTESDPLQWLKENKGDYIARVLLWTALTRIRSLVQSIQLADKAGRSTSFDNYVHWLGNLLRLSEDTEPFRNLTGTHPATVSPALLRTIFQQLHMLRGRDGKKTISQITNNEIWLLLDDLFQLPVAYDPLQRIEDKHNHLAAVETLRQALAQLQPPRHLLVGQTMTDVAEEVFNPKIRLRVRGQTVELHEIIFGKSSFALTLRTRVSERSFSLPQDVHGKGIWWQGVERVTDDLGHHYLVCYRPEEGGNRLWWFDHSLQLICYPAIVPGTAEVTLHSYQMALVVMGVTPGDQMRKPRPFHQIQLGDLTWRIKLSR